MPDRPDIRQLTFNEDDFDLESFKETAQTRTQNYMRVQRMRRQLSVCRIVIMVLAFIIAFWLYSMASKLIMQYDYDKYHTTTEWNG